MWNCSSPHPLPLLLQQYGDDYARCESSSSSAGSVGLDRILAAEYGRRFDSLNLSPPLHGLQQAQTIFAMHGGSENCLGIGANPAVYSGEARPAFSQLSFTQPTATAAHYSMKWTAAGETVIGDGSRLRGSKRLRTTTAAKTAAQGLQHGQRCNPKPTKSQSIKAPCKRSQKLGDKITALQQLVSPYGKTDTASVLHEAATCIKHLHEQIQILTASYPEISSPTSQEQDSGEEEGGATGLRRRGLCVAPLSPAVAQLVSAEAALRHRDAAGTEEHWRCLGTL